MTVKVEELILIAQQAGEIIRNFYQQQNFTQEQKEDSSPVTSADKQADKFICQALLERYPSIPIISEESSLASWDQRRGWKEFFLVDPLDGTKEFLKHNGEFTVNIAYISADLRLAVIYAPVLELLYWADGAQSYCQQNGQTQIIQAIFQQEIPLVVVSRSHINQETKEYLATLAPHQTWPVGSSLKLCYVAQGKAWLYPRLGPIKEWDIAAGVILAQQAGGEVLHLDQTPIFFNKEQMLVDPFYCQSQKVH